MTGVEPAIPLFRVFMADSVPAAAGEILASGQIASGPAVARFEAALQPLLGRPLVVGLSDHSAGLALALYLAGVRPGDAVLASPMTCLASSMPIASLFARPVWADVDPLTGMIDPADVEARLTPQVRAILVYHWAGDVAEIEVLAAIAARHGLPLIQDASAALGAEIGGQPLGAFPADYSLFSFYPSKPLACGNGAALSLHDPALAARARRVRRYDIDVASFRRADGDLNPDSPIGETGFNCAIDQLMARIGLENLPHLPVLLARTRANAAALDGALAGVAGLTRLRRRRDARSAHWTYSLRVERRDDLIRKLREHGIASQRLHLRNDRYAVFAAARADLPGTDDFDAENLSLPCGWWVDAADIQRIADVLRSGW